jgi:uncharacterized protein YhbP (UPF0306 family)
MNKVEELVRQFLPTKNVMQLATCVNNQPWTCTVHYYTDDDLNFYWISTPERRHSQEIQQNPQVSAALLVHENTPEEAYVIGIQIEGKAEIMPNIDKDIGQAYIEKLNKELTLVEDIASGKNHHKFYKLIPNSIVLFDSKNFSGNPRQEWRLK